MESSSSSLPQHLVFINFRGDELRHNFISHLYNVLRADGINAFIDNDDGVRRDISDLFKRIEESRIALAVFSSRYTESEWCLEELVRIKERAEESKLVVIPIFYKVTTSTVKNLEGVFGQKLMELAGERRDVARKWQQALEYVTRKRGLLYDGNSNEREFIAKISKDVKTLLLKISSDEMCRVIGSQERGGASMDISQGGSSSDCIISTLGISRSSTPKRRSTGPGSLPGRFQKVVKLKDVHWLEIKGRSDPYALTHGTTYEVVFLVKLEKTLSGWDRPVNLELVLPDGKISIRQENLRKQTRGQWLEIPAGEFVTPPEDSGDIAFSMYERNTQSEEGKTGLLIKGVSIRPKSH